MKTRVSVKEIFSTMELFWTTYNTRSLGCIEATYLLIHYRAIRKANVTIPSSLGGGLEID